MNIFTKEWLRAVMIRTIRTMAQTAAAIIGTGALLSDVNWLSVLSATAMAGVICILMALAGLPEAKSDGTLYMVDVDQDTVAWNLNVDTPLDELPDKKSVRLVVQDKTKQE